jgi:AcrR family transcriptional regulator
MPRPRKASDDEIFAAAARAMRRLPPGELTLAAIADEAGVTAGALVQRFGSKHALLVRLAESAAETAGALADAIRARHRSPLAALRDYVSCFADLAASPDAFARNLAYLTDDLTDPDLRRHLARQSEINRQAIETWLAQAAAAGELRADTPPRRLARLIEAVVAGSMLTWATYRTGPADRWMRRDLDAVLDPYRA